ncbi:MAG: type IV pilus secretin PilQ [Gammaproteobacteria bacterium]|nr:type IV pilus secretin PilQ [Gammaproteobacteria bacterium]
MHGPGLPMLLAACLLAGDFADAADDEPDAKAPPIPEEATAPSSTYRGEELSFNFQDIEVRAALLLIADFAGTNLVASDTVSGNVTLRLNQVPWDQALDLILRTRGLGKRVEGNVLLVAPADELAERERLELTNRKQLSELAPLTTEFMQVRYANASELFGLLTRGDSEASVLSERGSVIVDERTNAVVLTDTADNLAKVRGVISQLDVPVRQVQIESRIVNANVNFSERLGVRWGGGTLRRPDSGSDSPVLKLGGSRETLAELQNIAAEGSGTISSPGDLVVDLPSSGQGATRLGIGITNGIDYLLDLELSALATEGQAEIVARPTLITADKQPATIQSGVEIPYQEASSSGATSTSFKEAVLSLEVTPRITPDERIIMDLRVNQDSVGQVFNGVPSIDTTAISTRVLVENGQTLVLGGMFRTDRNFSVTKTPLLGDVPYLGRLFRRTIERDDKQELLIFITPRIIDEAGASTPGSVILEPGGNPA